MPLHFTLLCVLAGNIILSQSLSGYGQGANLSPAEVKQGILRSKWKNCCSGETRCQSPRFINLLFIILGVKCKTFLIGK